MKEFPDKYFELAIVDPLGIGWSKNHVNWYHYLTATFKLPIWNISNAEFQKIIIWGPFIRKFHLTIGLG